MEEIVSTINRKIMSFALFLGLIISISQPVLAVTTPEGFPHAVSRGLKSKLKTKVPTQATSEGYITKLRRKTGEILRNKRTIQTIAIALAVGGAVVTLYNFKKNGDSEVKLPPFPEATFDLEMPIPEKMPSIPGMPPVPEISISSRLLSYTWKGTKFAGIPLAAQYASTALANEKQELSKKILELKHIISQCKNPEEKAHLEEELRELEQMSVAMSCGSFLPSIYSKPTLAKILTHCTGKIGLSKAKQIAIKSVVEGAKTPGTVGDQLHGALSGTCRLLPKEFLPSIATKFIIAHFLPYYVTYIPFCNLKNPLVPWATGIATSMVIDSTLGKAAQGICNYILKKTIGYGKTTTTAPTVATIKAVPQEQGVQRKQATPLKRKHYNLKGKRKPPIKIRDRR
jgi:hypothetical protein